MLASYPIQNWQIVLVDAEHLRRPDPTRRARVALALNKDEPLLLPTFADRYRIAGYRVSRAYLTENSPDEWQEIEPQTWQPGEWPFVISEGVLDFISPDVLRHHQHIAAKKAIVESMDGERSFFDRSSLLEYCDDVLGGHAATCAALLNLWDNAQSNDRLLIADDREELEARLRASIPVGTMHLHRRLKDLSLEQPHLEAALERAASSAFDLEHVFKPDTWAQLRTQVRRDWSERAVKAGYCADAPLDRSFDNVEKTSRELEFLGYAHTARLRTFSQQGIALERLLPTGALTRWVTIQRELLAITTSLGARPGQEPWRAAESAASRIRQLAGQPIDAPIKILELLDALGIAVAGATFPSKNAESGWMSTAGCPPLLLLAPAALETKPGTLRFILARALGALIKGAVRGRAYTWGLSQYTEADERGPSPFSNAFAIYLIAPRGGVNLAIDSYPQADQDREIFESAEQIGRHFGLTHGAALSHMVNGLPKCNRHERLTQLRSNNDHMNALKQSITEDPTWHSNADMIRRLTGGRGICTPEQALRRPTSSYFDGLVQGASAEGLLSSAICQDLQLAT